MGKKLIQFKVGSFSLYIDVPLLTALDKLKIYSTEEKLKLEAKI
jgi:hypothetical protein